MTHEEFRRQTLARIAANDYTMIGVAPERSRGLVSPGFTYSIGLWTFRQVPEVIVVGMPTIHAQEMIVKYAELTASGCTFTPGQWSDEFVPGYRFVFERVARRHYQEWFAKAFEFYPDGNFPALQLLWPDRQGNYPWRSQFGAACEPNRDRCGRVNPEPQPLLTGSGRPESFDPWR
jgi:hypothetical protein